MVQLDFISFDLETTNLTADFSVLLSSVIKPFGQDPVVFRADELNPEWATNRKNDRAIVLATRNELAKHAVVIGHYMLGFDIPYLKAKLAYWQLEPLPALFGFDTYYTARTAFRVSSRRLQNLAAYFGLGEKHEVRGELWMKAGMDGDIDAMNEIVEHNVQDCVILEKLAQICFPYLRSLRKI